MCGQVESVKVTVGIYQHEMHYLYREKGAIVEQMAGCQERPTNTLPSGEG